MAGRGRFVVTFMAVILLGMTTFVPARAAFPGRNGRLAFEFSGHIYTANADGSGYTTIDAPSNNFSPAWSPDGRKIVFISVRDGQPNIYVMNSDGTAQTRITDNANGIAAQDPSWSPDCRQFAFVRQSGGNPSIWVVNADGSGGNNITYAAHNDSEPSWSPDGKLIAVAQGDGGGGARIAVMRTDGSNRHVVNPNANSSATPSWSPDGSRIAYWFGGSQPGVWTMKADGTDQRRVVNGGAEPAWSPDGKLIVFDVSNNNNQTMLETIRPDGTGEAPVMDPLNPGHAIVGDDPDWQPASASCSRPSSSAAPTSHGSSAPNANAPASRPSTKTTSGTSGRSKTGARSAASQASSPKPSSSVASNTLNGQAPFGSATSTRPGHHGIPVWPFAVAATGLATAAAGSLFYYRRSRLRT